MKGPTKEMMIEASRFSNKQEKRQCFIICGVTLAIGLICVIITYTNI